MAYVRDLLMLLSLQAFVLTLQAAKGLLLFKYWQWFAPVDYHISFPAMWGGVLLFDVVYDLIRMRLPKPEVPELFESDAESFAKAFKGSYKQLVVLCTILLNGWIAHLLMRYC